MKLRRFINLLECGKKDYYSSLNLTTPGKEAHYPKLFSFIGASIGGDYAKAAKALDLYVAQLYPLAEFRNRRAQNEVVQHVSALFKRLLGYLLSQSVELVEQDSMFEVYQVDEEPITQKVDFILQHESGEIEGIIFQSQEPQYSYLGRKFDTKAENSPEINALLRYLMLRFPGESVRATLLYLKNKEDKHNDYKPFEHKKGANIISYSKQERFAKIRLESAEQAYEVIEETIKAFMTLKKEKSCDDCRYRFICQFEERKGTTAKRSIQLSEQAEAIAHKTNSIKSNEEQKRILEDLTGISQVVAVPGAGKTRIIVEAVRKLVSQGINPKSILILTFTNRATEELEMRLKDIEGVRITNYNTFGYRLVRRHFSELGFDVPPRLVTKYEAFNLLLDIVDTFGLPYRYEYGFNRSFGQMPEIYQAVNFALSQGMKRNIPLMPLESYEYTSRFNLSDKTLEMLPLITNAYISKLLELNMITYEQQVELAHKLLKQNADLLHALVDTYKYVFLDEYQDTNFKQHQFIQMFCKNNVMMVGDEDQSIFGFRGSNPSNFLSFMKDGDKKYYLSRNYRSGSAITDVANALISQNQYRNRKSIVCASQREGVYEERILSNTDDICQVVEQLLELNYLPEEIAIITRKNKHIETLQKLLDERGVCSSSSFNRLLDHPDFIKFYAFLSVCTFKAKRLEEYIVLKHIYNQEDFVKGNGMVNSVIRGNSPLAERMLKDIQYVSESVAQKEQCKRIFEVTGLSEANVLAEVTNMLDDLYIASLSELQMVLSGMIVIDDDISLSSSSEGVNLLTAHASKGLEFRAVIIYQVEDFEVKDDEEEERRLLYVAMTRAKEYLCITSTKEKPKQIYRLKIV